MVLRDGDLYELQRAEQNHAPEKWLAILMEEVGEVAKAMLENEYEKFTHDGPLDWRAWEVSRQKVDEAHALLLEAEAADAAEVEEDFPA